MQREVKRAEIRDDTEDQGGHTIKRHLSQEEEKRGYERKDAFVQKTLRIDAGK